MDIERECSVCKEDALYYCRMCISHYCVEHLCMHLSVAQEENSYTNRTEEIEDENKGSETNQGTERLGVSELSTATTVQNPLQPLESYSKEELSELYYFYSNATRRIRFELERRAVSLEGFKENNAFQQIHRKDKLRKNTSRNPPGISARRAVSLLSNNLRNGNVSLEYIIARMNALRTR